MKYLTRIRRRNIIRITFFTAALFIVAFLFQGCNQNKSDLKKEDFKTEYQGIILNNGMAYFGKIEKIESQYILITNVFYFQSIQNPETKQVENRLIKRGKEWHGPKIMFLNRQNIIMIEPVEADSKLMQAIKEYK